MGHIQYVGRVGALAVALGIGSAIAGGAGLAHADGTESAPAGDVGPANDADGGSGGDAATPRKPALKPFAGLAGLRDAFSGNHEIRIGRHTEDASVQDDSADSAVARTRTVQSGQSNRAAQSTREAPSLRHRIQVPRVDVPRVEPTEHIAPVAAPDPVAPVEHEVAQTITSRAVPQGARLVTREPARTAATVSSVVSGVLGFGHGTAGSTPISPTDNPILLSVLAWARRTLFNRPPTVAYDPQETEQVDGVITGDVVGTDRDGDAVTYRVVRGPTHGSVTVDEATGEFTYVRDGNDTVEQADDYAGPDEFTVAVSDEGSAPHIHGLLGLFGLRTHETVQTVRLTVAADPLLSDEASNSESAIEGPQPQFYVAPDGRVFDVDYDEATKQATVTETRNGVSTVRVATQGAPVGGMVFADNGVAYQTLYDEDAATEQTSVLAFSPTGDYEQAFHTGKPVGGVVLNPASGQYYQTVTRAAIFTVVTDLWNLSDSSGSTTLSNRADAPVVFDKDGNAYITTDRGDGTTVLSFVRRGTDGAYSLDDQRLTLDGETEGGVVVDPTTGVAYWTVQREVGEDAEGRDIIQTTVAAVDPVTFESTDGTIDPDTVVLIRRIGSPQGNVVFAEGAAYQTLSTRSATGDLMTSVLVLHPDPDLLGQVDLPGVPGSEPPIPSADGSGVYQARTVHTADGPRTVVTLVRADGSAVDVAELPGGQPRGALLGPDGNYYVLTRTFGPEHNWVNIVDTSTGEVTSIETSHGSEGLAVDDAGTVYWAIGGDASTPTSVTAYNPSTRNTSTYLLSGRDFETALRTAPDGTVYIVTKYVNPANGETVYNLTDFDSPLPPITPAPVV